MKNGPKTLKDTSTKKIYTWHVSTGKDATYHHMTTEKQNSKENTITYLWQRLKSRILTALNAD